jgi:hypothetical protein
MTVVGRLFLAVALVGLATVLPWDEKMSNQQRAQAAVVFFGALFLFVALGGLQPFFVNPSPLFPSVFPIISRCDFPLYFGRQNFPPHFPATFSTAPSIQFIRTAKVGAFVFNAADAATHLLQPPV